MKQKIILMAILTMQTTIVLTQTSLNFTTKPSSLRIKKTFTNNTDKNLVLKWSVSDKDEVFSYKQEPLVLPGKTIVLDFSDALSYIHKKLKNIPDVLNFSLTVFRSASLPKQNKRLLNNYLKSKDVKNRVGDPDHAVAYEAKSAQIEKYKKVKGSISKLTKNNFLNYDSFEFYSTGKEPISLNLL